MDLEIVAEVSSAATAGTDPAHHACCKIAVSCRFSFIVNSLRQSSCFAADWIDEPTDHTTTTTTFTQYSFPATRDSHSFESCYPTASNSP